MSRHVLLLTLMALPVWAGAVTLGSHTRIGKDVFMEDVSVDGDVDVWDWSLGYMNTRSVDHSQETVDGKPIIDETHDLRGGLGWTEKPWGVTVDLETAQTPQERLHNNSAYFGVQYQELSRRWSLKATLGGSNFVQGFSGVVKPKNQPTRPITGQNVIHQSSLRVDGKWRAAASWLLKLSLTGYHYDKDPEEFESLLESAKGVNRGMVGFTGVVGGLPSASAALSVLWYFTDSWDLSVSQSLSFIATDHSRSRVTRIMIDGDITDHWSISVGGEKDQSTTDNDAMAVIGIEYTF